MTGHRSEALDAYQIMSEQQRESISNILACGNNVEMSETHENVSDSTVKSSINQQNSEGSKSHNSTCVCKCNVKSDQKKQLLGEIITEIVERNIKSDKTVIKNEIEDNNE